MEDDEGKKGRRRGEQSRAIKRNEDAPQREGGYVSPLASLF
jgi:hypothetical protein